MTPQERAAWNAMQGQATANTHAVRKVLASGTAQLAPTTPSEGAALSWQAPNGEAVECHLAVGQLGIGNGDIRADWFAAARVIAPGAPPVLEVQALKVEYGAGGSPLVAFMDIRSGFIPLPPVNYVRVSLTAFYTDGSATTGGTGLRLPVSLVEGISPQSDVPTYTIDAMENGAYDFPPQAHAVELINPGKLYYGAFAKRTQIVQHSTATPPVVAPPWSPVRLARGGALAFQWENEPTAGLFGHCIFLLGL